MKLDRFEAMEIHEVQQVVAVAEFYRVVICRATQVDDTPYLIRIKRLLTMGYFRRLWSFDSHLAVLREFVPADEVPFYEALAAAILDEACVARLNEFPRWRDLPSSPVNPD